MSVREDRFSLVFCILFCSFGEITRLWRVFARKGKPCRQVSSFGCFVFEFRVLCFRDLGAPFSSFWVLGASFSIFGCFVFEFWVLRFRDLGSLFSIFGCFVLWSSFSSASKLSVIKMSHMRRSMSQPLWLKGFAYCLSHDSPIDQVRLSMLIRYICMCVWS